MNKNVRKNIYFKAITPLDKEIRITKDYWDKIIKTKHPNMKGKENLVRNTLENPDEIRRSKSDGTIHLYYKFFRKYNCCVVTKNINDEGYIVTTYMTDKVKEGKQIWVK